MIDCSSFATPMAIKSLPNELDQTATYPTEYRQIVGGLQYLTFSRPDIQHAVNKDCQHFQEPTEGHFCAVRRILWYLKGTIDYGVCFLH